MRKIFYFTILFLFVALTCVADDISISAEVDKNEISLNDQVTLTITVSGNISNIPEPKIPPINGFTTYAAGRSQKISIINRQVSSSISFNYCLVPNDIGDYTIGPFDIEYKGQTYSAGPIQIKVVPSAQRPRQPVYQPSPYPQAPPEEEAYPEKKAGKELFIQTYVDKLRAYVNEQITLTFAFFQAVELFENPVYTPPSTTGFWVEDMPPQRKYYKTIDGRQYLVTEIKTALFATSPGEFTIGPARLEATIEDLQRFFSRNPFDIFDQDPFSIFRTGKPVILTTEPINVEILPLPEANRPANFGGDVGRYEISASLDKNSVEENQPVTLKIKIQGEGNIKTVFCPQIPQIENVKFYDSGSSENISKANYTVQGEKVFEKVLIPQKDGDFIIGPVSYSYFDPIDKRYKINQIGPMTITATKAKEKEVRQTVLSLPGLSKEEVRLLKQDIRYIKTSPLKHRKKDAHLYKDKIFSSFNMLPLIFLIIVYIYQSHKNRLKSDIRYARSRRAMKNAGQHLREAKKQLGDTKVFFAQVQAAFLDYIGDKLNLPSASLTSNQIESLLISKDIERGLLVRLKSLLELCDMARFASGTFNVEDMKKSLKEASQILALLDKRL